MVGVLLITIFNPLKKKGQQEEILTPKRKALSISLFFFVGLYGGFIQAGIGFIMIAVLTIVNQLSMAIKHNVANPDFLPYFPFFPYGKGFDYVLTDPPNYVFASGDEDFGIFDHYMAKDLPIFHNPHTRWIFVSIFHLSSFFLGN